MPIKTRGFAHRADIAATPARVWTVLCGPSILPLWLAPDARIKPQKDGHWSATVAPGLFREAIIDVFEPPRRLRLIYLPPAHLDLPEGAIVDDILVDTEDKNTVVRLLCSGVPDSIEWSAYFMKLRQATERGLGRLRVLVEQRERMAIASRSKK
jgi:uncharacterized protein YndB with AHSA1/START domain